MTEVELPRLQGGVRRRRRQGRLRLPPHPPLQKYLNTDFAKKGGKAAAFLKKFTWTTEDQNEVSLMIADQKLSPADAAKKWVDGHPATWKAWLS